MKLKSSARQTVPSTQEKFQKLKKFSKAAYSSGFNKLVTVQHPVHFSKPIMTPLSNTSLAPILFVVQRGWEPKTLAIITAAVSNPKLKNSNNFVKVLRKCVTRWVNTTEQGKSCFAYAGADLNIGDLLTYGDSELNRILEHNGIHQFNQDTYDNLDAGDWTYDTVLVNEEDIITEENNL